MGRQRLHRRPRVLAIFGLAAPWPWLSYALVGLALAYRADLLALFGLAPPWPWLSYAVTGLVIGRGTNFVHDFATRWLTPTRDGLAPAR
jgi:uncharacterized membrane protein YuzA (DUF378 family)